jgi:hypothetical protein
VEQIQNLQAIALASRDIELPKGFADVHDQHVLVEARVDGAEPLDGPNRQPGADEL